MALYNDSTIAIYFGDTKDQLFMSDALYESLKRASALLDVEPFSRLHDTMHVTHILFPRQVHGTSGFIIDAKTIHSIKPFSIESDYVITNLPHAGIGVLTADCLPILLHDNINQVIAAIHAGWRGAVAGIAVKALDHMRASFGTKPNDVRVFFGPSAGRCCYSVGPEVIEAVKPYKDQVLETRNNLTFFDLVGYNRLLLESTGILASAFCTDNAQCTICHPQFWSYRRQQVAAGRQMTVMSLI